MQQTIVHQGAPDPFAPATLGPLTLRNRTVKSATYENMARDGLATDALIDFHVAQAVGGVGMTTVAYCSVSREGRTDGRQIYWRPDAMPGLRRLTDALHGTGAAISAQIGNSGPVGNPKQTWGPGAVAQQVLQPAEPALHNPCHPHRPGADHPSAR